jgi:hypothetical protein
MSKPRDLGLLLWCLLYRVPVESPITEQWIEVARGHCKLAPERLAELRAEPYTKLWERMEQKRARRLAYFQAHGIVPRSWTPLAPGEQDRTIQVQRMKLYWKTRAKRKARARKGSGALMSKIMKVDRAIRKMRSPARQMAALEVLESMLMDQFIGASPNTSFREYIFDQELRSDREKEFNRLSKGRKKLRAIGTERCREG